MDLGQRDARPELSAAALARVTLLDTNALIWLHQGHRRARALARVARLYVSPASLLELQFLAEAGRLRFGEGVSLSSIEADPRWSLDEPPAGRWFSAAVAEGWTRDPFDRLIVAHARVRGWKLATGDDELLERLGPARGLGL